MLEVRQDLESVAVEFAVAAKAECDAVDLLENHAGAHETWSTD